MKTTFSRRELYAFGEPIGDGATVKKVGGGRIYGLGGGGGGGPSSSTTNTSNIPDWLRPQVESLIGGATQQMFNTKPNAAGGLDITGTKPFIPYSANPQDYVAGFSPLQQQVQANAANLNMPSQFNSATNLASTAGKGALDSTGMAYGYGAAGSKAGNLGQQIGTTGGQYYGDLGAQAGNTGVKYGDVGAQYGSEGAKYGSDAANIGQMALESQAYGRGVGDLAKGYAAQSATAGADYLKSAGSPTETAKYISPFMQNVVDVQNKEAQRSADIAGQTRNAMASRAGAFGGARNAIENAEARRNLATLQNANQATGLQNAYDAAQKNLQFGASTGLTGLTGASTNLNTALEGGKLGLSGINTALTGTGQGIAGAQAGIQGANTGIAGANTGIAGANAGLAGVDRSLAGTAQGIAGANAGLSGVSNAQAGLGLANTAGTNLANIGAAQLNAQEGILGLQNQIGGQQQGEEQNVINNAINNFAQEQLDPQQKMAALNSLIRGYATPTTTSQNYVAPPSALSQVTGGALTAVAANKLINSKKGGLLKTKKKSARSGTGLADLSLYNAMNGR